MHRIDLETGNITTGQRIFFHLTKDESITMGTNTHEASFPVDQWSLFLEQMNDAFRGIPSKKSWWQQLFNFDRYSWIKGLKEYPTPPLGSAEMKSVINNSLGCTPAYQLFLASIDITARFLFEEEDRRYEARSLISVGRVHTTHTGSSIFLIDDTWLGDGLEELLDGNRLCRVVFDNKITRYYIPYACPFQPKLSKQADKTWSNLRSRYYDWRWGS